MSIIDLFGDAVAAGATSVHIVAKAGQTTVRLTGHEAAPADKRVDGVAPHQTLRDMVEPRLYDEAAGRAMIDEILALSTILGEDDFARSFRLDGGLPAGVSLVKGQVNRTTGDGLYLLAKVQPAQSA